MILKRYLRLKMFVDWWDLCVCRWKHLPNAGEKNWSGDTPVGASAQQNPLLNSNKDSPERLRTHLCELRNAMFYIQIQWPQNSMCTKCFCSVSLFHFFPFFLIKTHYWLNYSTMKQSQNLLHKVLFKCRGKVVKKNWINEMVGRKAKGVFLDQCVNTLLCKNNCNI